MILEIDAGNTRIKWRLRKKADSGQWLKIADGVVFALDDASKMFTDLGALFDSLKKQNVSRILVASVRGELFRKFFTTLTIEKWNLKAEFAVSVNHFSGVTNGYEDASKLGVDRWLAILAAYQDWEGECCVVDCGTTITVDFVKANGQHLGGYIVPGLHMQRDALAAKSKALATESVGWISTTPGDCTAAAIENGILSLVSGFLRDIHEKTLISGGEACLYVTGGDAAILAPYLNFEFQLVPDLVLDGLALVMVPFAI